MTNASPRPWEKGQTLLLEFRRHGGRQPEKPDLSPYVITGIGPKWVTLSKPDGRGGWNRNTYRFRRSRTACPIPLDGGEYTSPGAVWRTEAECIEHRSTALAWQRLQRQIAGQYVVPPGITREHVTQIEAILKSAEEDDDDAE